MASTPPSGSKSRAASKDQSAGGEESNSQPMAGQRPVRGGVAGNGGPVCVVLAGAGARGAYEAGMLSVLLPRLEICGARPEMFIGTSAGAINAVLFASLAHLPAQVAAARALDLWRGITKDQVFKTLSPTALARLLRSPLGQAGVVGQSLTGLLDTDPLAKTLREKIDWDQLHANTASGKVQAVAVAATACASGRTEVFAEGPRTATLPPSDNDRAVDYTRTALSADHVLASAAIPVLFPPVELHSRSGWYMDGGVRLNAPLKPAIALDADRIVTVATTPDTYMPPVPSAMGMPRPTIQGIFAQLLDGAIGDRMIEDLSTLKKMNKLASEAESSTGQLPVSPTKREYKIIDYLFGGPAPGGDQLGDIAANVLATRFPLLRRLTHPDLAFLTFLLGPSQDSGELLSYIFFEPEFIDAAIRQGQQDALIILQDKPNCADLFQQ